MSGRDHPNLGASYTFGRLGAPLKGSSPRAPELGINPFWIGWPEGRQLSGEWLYSDKSAFSKFMFPSHSRGLSRFDLSGEVVSLHAKTLPRVYFFPERQSGS